MSQVGEVCRRFSEEIMQHRSSSRVVDVLSKQINDPNTKVACNALRIFTDLAYKLPSLVEGSLSVIMNEIFICFSCSKADVRQLA